MVFKKKALPAGRAGKVKSKKTSSDGCDKRPEQHKIEQYDKIEQHKKSEQKSEQLFFHLRSFIKELSTDDLVYLLYKKNYQRDPLISQKNPRSSLPYSLPKYI